MAEKIAGKPASVDLLKWNDSTDVIHQPVASFDVRLLFSMLNP